MRARAKRVYFALVIGVAIVSGIAVIGLVSSILFFPSLKIGKHSFSTYWLFPLLGGVILLATGLLDPNYFLDALLGDAAINPIEILALFFSMVFMSIVLDEVGFFRCLAVAAAKKAKQSQTAFFLLLYLAVSILTVFTSNDIIVITFTPFIIFFARHAKISPLPYLVGEFVAANTWSTLLIVGNPTNIYLASSFGIDFFAYLEHMFIPTVSAGLTALAVIFMIFRKKLKDPISVQPGEEKIIDKPILAVSASLLGICIVLVAVSSWIDLPMWLPALISAAILFLFVLIYGIVNRKDFFVTTDSLRRLPYNLIPMLLGMFAIVLACKQSGITEAFADLLGPDQPIMVYGIASFVAANFLNNIPMSVFFTEVIRAGNEALYPAVYATILSSNVAAVFTPIGALAGGMWMGLLKQNDIRFTFVNFTFYGAMIAIPTLLAGLGGLYLAFLLFP